MASIIDALGTWGCDTKCVQTRFLGDEDFYLQMLQLAATDKNYENLTQALAAEDAKAAFTAAHTLKGMLGNMGLTPLYNACCQVVEPLRAGRLEDALALNQTFIQTYQTFMQLLEQNGVLA